MRRLRPEWVLLAAPLWAQSGDARFSGQGLLQVRGFGFMRASPFDAGRLVAEGLLRYDAGVRVSPWLRVEGSVEARTDTHRVDAREWQWDWSGQAVRRPAMAVRRLSATWRRRRLTVEVGKQWIHWGQSDFANPTARFAPRDYSYGTDAELLAVPAARVSWGGLAGNVELVYAPRLSPSRLPPLASRWLPLPDDFSYEIRDRGSHVPGGPQFGARLSGMRRSWEGSVSYFDGYYQVPVVQGTAVLTMPISVGLDRYFPRIRSYGADFAVPLGGFLVKGEAAYVGSRSPLLDSYAQYVIQAERTVKQWLLAGGYVGEAVVEERRTPRYDPERALSRALVARARHEMDARRAVVFDVAARRDGAALLARAEYTQTVAARWQAVWGVTWIRGDREDRLGQYWRGSHAMVTIRYGF